MKGAKNFFNYIFFFIVISTLVGSLIIFIVFMIITPESIEVTTFDKVRLFVPLSIYSFIGLFSLGIWLNKKRLAKKAGHSEYDDLLEDKPVVSEKNNEREAILKPIPFIGDKELQMCSLCNKLIIDGHLIITCPVCYAIYHYDHILDWLKNNHFCPSCNTKL